MRTRAGARAAGAVGLAVLASARAGVAAGGHFPLPVNLSRTAASSYLPSIAVERAGPTAGAFRVFWHDFTDNPNLIRCVASDGVAWGASGVCVPNVTRSWSPRAVTDALGATHLVWRDSTGGGPSEIWYARFAGGVWSPPVD